MNPMNPAIPQFDQTQARAEGWRLACINPDSAPSLQHLEIKTATTHFDSDSHAEREVYHKARDGSAYHRQALELLWHSERRPSNHPLDTPVGRVIRRLDAGFAEAPQAFKGLLAAVDPAAKVLGADGFELTPLGLLNGALHAVGTVGLAAQHSLTGEFVGFTEYREESGVPDEYAGYPFHAWRAAVAAAQTAFGYDDWVHNQREEYADYPFRAWRAAVAAQQTALGYDDWAHNQREDAAAEESLVVPSTNWQQLATELGEALGDTAERLAVEFARADRAQPREIKRASRALALFRHAKTTPAEA